MKKIFMTTVIASTLLSGCVSTMMDFSKIPGTSFVAPPTSVSDMDKFKQDITKVNKKVVSDELGTYYWQLNGDQGVYSLTMKQEDLPNFKYLFSKSVGLMEPLYTYNSNADLILDKNGSKKRYDYLTNTLGIKLRPFAETIKYHSYLNNRAKAEFNKMVADGFYGGAQAFNGNVGVYNSDYYSSLTPYIGDNFSYIVKNTGANSYYRQIGTKISIDYSEAKVKEMKSNSSDPRAKYMGSAKKLDDASKYKLATSIIRADSIGNISFVPMDFYKNVKTGGLFTINTESGCFYADFNNMRTQFENTGSIPYFSAINKLVKDKDEGNIAKSKKEFFAEVRNVSNKRSSSEKSCLVGLNALDLAGVIESKKLR